MKTIIHNITNSETVYASVQLNRADMKALREFMHTKDSEVVAFPGNIVLAYRGRGWYRLTPLYQTRIIENFKFALSVLRKFSIWQEEMIEAEIKALMPTVINPNIQQVAYTDNQYTFVGGNSVQEQSIRQGITETAVMSLHNLAAKFGHQLKTKTA